MRWVVLLGAVAFLAVIGDLGGVHRAAAPIAPCQTGSALLTPTFPMATVDGVMLQPNGGRFTTDAGLSFTVDDAVVVPLDAGVLASVCGNSISGLVALTAIDPFGDGGTVTVLLEVPP